MSLRLPSHGEADAGRAVLMDVLTILGRYRDGMVLIGGWVPEVAFPRRGHIGSFDVDLALDPRKIPREAYDSMRQARLLDHGYTQTEMHSGTFMKDVDAAGDSIAVKLDLVTGQAMEAEPDASNALVQDLRLSRLRGVEIALEHTVTISLIGLLPSGATNTVTVRVVTVPAYLCMKAFALDERRKEKDAYDIYFCLRHFDGGPAGLAKACLAITNGAGVRDAISILRRKFETLHSIGPQWAADVASGQGEDREMVARDAFERFASFINALDALTR